jgi:uncharacterized Zn finger protein
MAGRAVFAARLLAGEMPREIDEVFRARRASLFPERPKDLKAACTCPDWANPCKHVAAVHYVLGDTFDRDPFLLFELRGRPRTAVLATLRRLRGSSPEASTRSSGEGERTPDALTLKHRTPEGYERLGEGVKDLRFHIGTPTAEGAIFRQLGSPPSWGQKASPRDLLGPAVARAAALARELALAPTTSEGLASSDQAARRKPHRTPR